MDEPTLRRRDFLARTAAAAGLAGLSSLPAGTLLAEAATAQRQMLPSARNLPIDHIVVVMMENRSFDHYFGWLEGADGDQTQSYLDAATGKRVRTRHASTLEAEWQGCGHPDPGHGWEQGRAQLDGGFLAEGSGNDEFALTYYDEGEIEFLHAAAKQFTVYDRFFCSVLSSTWPNRYYKWSAQSGGRKDNAPPLDTAGNQWETIFDRALGRGVSARYYNSDLPFSAVWGARGATWTHPLAEYYADCALGRLPNLSFVDPPFRDGGGGDGISADEHPHGDVRLGQAWMADVVRAFVESLAIGEARCSWCTTSGAGSSTTFARPACATRGRAVMRPRTSARWDSASRPSRSRRTRGGAAGATRGCDTRRSASSRSSSSSRTASGSGR
jgi:phospholipase C